VRLDDKLAYFLALVQLVQTDRLVDEDRWGVLERIQRVATSIENDLGILTLGGPFYECRACKTQVKTTAILEGTRCPACGSPEFYRWEFLEGWRRADDIVKR